MLSIIVICLAHLVRVYRWELFISIYEKPKARNLIRSLSLGYLINNIVPFKFGDLIRAIVSGKKMKNGMALGLSTVIVDRYLDVVCVGIIFVVLTITGNNNYSAASTATLYMGIAIIGMILMIAVFVFRGYIKKIIRAFASVFNKQIETSILKFAWALIWNFKDIFQKIGKRKLVATTFIMWMSYLVSYYIFAISLKYAGLNATWIDIFTMLFTQNGIKDSSWSSIVIGNSIMKEYELYVAGYLLIPIVLLYTVSYIVKYNVGEKDGEDNYLNLLPHLDPNERLDFLETYFSNSNREYVSNYLKINQDITIIRDYSAGSNATTMLCTDGEKTFFRKYAFGEDAEKLYQQIEWIEENADKLPLPQIMKKDKTDIYCYYDMPYSSNSVGLFEYAHSMPVSNAWDMIREALESLESSVYKVNTRNADKKTIDKYIQSKVLKNLDTIKSAKRIRNLQQYDVVYINGVAYKNLKYYEKYLSEEYLERIFSNDTYATIHGDLTIENIICTRDINGKDDFYIIDPNTGNLHDSPNLDYGKLLQSIHGGYEFLMSTKDVQVAENNINFMFTRSSVYIELHNRLKEYMLETFGKERTRSIYFHEIIHWLRLMPYKINKDGKRALLFYAGMLMVMNDVIDMYGDLETE
ncbi:MAG: flippase-like domain-containing protein [Cellulosilyticum sp.]|nr:flippase-like domain-containing protein [Cellulosilyticum sp.]